MAIYIYIYRYYMYIYIYISWPSGLQISSSQVMRCGISTIGTWIWRIISRNNWAATVFFICSRPQYSSGLRADMIHWLGWGQAHGASPAPNYRCRTAGPDAEFGNAGPDSFAGEYSFNISSGLSQQQHPEGRDLVPLWN